MKFSIYASGGKAKAAVLLKAVSKKTYLEKQKPALEKAERQTQMFRLTRRLLPETPK